MNDDFDNLSANNLEQFQFTTPDMQEHRWENIFEKMNILRCLETLRG